MAPLHISLSALLLPSLLSLSSASGSENPLLSCEDVSCPVKDGTTLADCRVANQSFTAVGLTSIEVSGEIFDAEDDVELTWTVGLDSYEHVDGDGENDSRRNLERVYYLGTPPGVDLAKQDESSGVGGCAV